MKRTAFRQGMRLVFWVPLLLSSGCGKSLPPETGKSWQEVCSVTQSRQIKQTVNDVASYMQIRRTQYANFRTGEIYNESLSYGICRYGHYLKTYGYTCDILDANSEKYTAKSPDLKPLRYEEAITYRIFVKDKSKQADNHPTLIIDEIYDRTDSSLLASSSVSQIYTPESSDWGAIPYEGLGAIITGGPTKSCGEFLYVGDVLRGPAVENTTAK